MIYLVALLGTSIAVSLISIVIKLDAIARSLDSIVYILGKER